MQANVTGAQYLMLMGGFLLVAFVLIAALVVYQWVLRRTGQLAAASPVSTISAVPTGAPTIALDDPELDDDVMSRNRRIVIGAHRLRTTLRTRTEMRELAAARTENRRLRQMLEEATAGQRAAIRELIKAEKDGKPITRTAATKLMGKAKMQGLVLIREVEDEIEQEARDRAPVPQMEPVPSR